MQLLVPCPACGGLFIGEAELDAHRCPGVKVVTKRGADILAWRKRSVVMGMVAMAGFWIARVIFRRKPISDDEDLVARLRRAGAL